MIEENVRYRKGQEEIGGAMHNEDNKKAKNERIAIKKENDNEKGKYNEDEKVDVSQEG